MFSVEGITDDYYPALDSNNVITRKRVVSFLRTLCHETEIQQFETDHAHLEGFGFIEEVLGYFNFTYKISGRDLERIPGHGRLVIVANHPIGTLDGLALRNLIRQVHPDVKVIASHYFGCDNKPATALNPHIVDGRAEKRFRALFSGTDYKKNFQTLKSKMTELGYSVPTLYKQYAEICEPGGVVFSDFNVEPDFSDCIDGFVIVDTEMAKASKWKRYLEINESDKMKVLIQ